MYNQQLTLKAVNLAAWPHSYTAVLYLDKQKVAELSSPQPGELCCHWVNPTSEIMANRLTDGKLLSWTDTTLLDRIKKRTRVRYCKR